MPIYYKLQNHKRMINRANNTQRTAFEGNEDNAENQATSAL